MGALEFMKYVFDIFGMTYNFEFSTQPKKALQEISLWDRAEEALASCGDHSTNCKWIGPRTLKKHNSL